MYGAKVQDEAKSRANAKGCERRDTPFDEVTIDPGCTCAFAGGAHRLRHDLDAGHVPPALSKANRPEPSATTEVECTPVWRLATAPLLVKERNGLFAYTK